MVRSPDLPVEAGIAIDFAVEAIAAGKHQQSCARETAIVQLRKLRDGDRNHLMVGRREKHEWRA